MQIETVFIPYSLNKEIKVLISDADYDAVPLKKGGKYTAHIAASDFIFLKVSTRSHTMEGYLKKDGMYFFIKIDSLMNDSTYTFSFTILDVQKFNPLSVSIKSSIHPDDNHQWCCYLFRNNMTLSKGITMDGRTINGEFSIDAMPNSFKSYIKKDDLGILFEYSGKDVDVFYFVAFCIDSENSFMNCFICPSDEIRDKHDEKIQEICHNLYIKDLHQKHSHYRVIHDKNVLYYDVSKKRHDSNENVRDRTIEITIEQWEIQTYLRAMSEGEYESLGSPQVNSTFKFTKSSEVKKFVTYEFEKEYIWTVVKSVLALPNPPTIFLEFTSSKSPTKISEVKPDYGELGGGIESTLNFTSEDTCTVKRKIDLKADFSIVLFDSVDDNKQYAASIIPNNFKDVNFEGNYDNHFICSASIEGKVKYYYLVKAEGDVYKVLAVNNDFAKKFLSDRYYPEYLKKNQKALLKVRIKKATDKGVNSQ